MNVIWNVAKMVQIINYLFHFEVQTINVNVNIMRASWNYLPYISLPGCPDRSLIINTIGLETGSKFNGASIIPHEKFRCPGLLTCGFGPINNVFSFGSIWLKVKMVEREYLSPLLGREVWRNGDFGGSK